MSIQESETVVPFTPDKRGQLSTTPVDESGRSIVALLGRAADVAKEDCSRAMDLAHKLAFQVRAAEERAQDAEERVRDAEERVQDAEERVRRLEAEAAHFRDAEERVRQLDSELLIFVTALFVRKIGWSTFTGKSSRRFFRITNKAPHHASLGKTGQSKMERPEPLQQQ